MKPFIVEFSTQAFGILPYCGGILISKLRWDRYCFTPNGIIRGRKMAHLFWFSVLHPAYTVGCIVSSSPSLIIYARFSLTDEKDH